MNSNYFETRASRFSSIILGSLLLMATTQAGAQVSGTRTIGVDYPSLADAVTDLNTVGISGPVLINIPAGYTETAPAGGYLLGSTVLNAASSVVNTLSIQKIGAGTNPLLTAPVGTSTTVDGIFFIQGTDYVTISGIDVTESAANTTATTWMEWGYALVKLQNTAPFDGCQHVTIQNCNITLNRLNTPTVGIYAGNHIAAATTALDIVAATDAMNDCRFYGNTVRNSVNGISLRGYAAASPYTLYDHNNDVGGTIVTTGNTIQNYGGTTSGTAINLQYQDDANVSHNTINNTASGGVASTAILYGIHTQNGTDVSVNVSNNNILLTQGTSGSAVYDIRIGSAGTGTINVNANTLSAAGGSTGAMYMIYFGGANTNVNTNDNIFYNIDVATTGTLALIYHAAANSPEYITCNNNQTAGPSIPYVTKTGAGGSVYGYYNNSGSTSGTATLTGNNFSYFSLAGSPTFYGLNETNGGSGQNKYMLNNVVSNVTSAGGTLYGLRMGFAASLNYTGNRVMELNSGTGSAYGIYVVSGTEDTVVNNSVHDLVSTGGSVYGIYVAGGTSVNVFSDTVNSLTTSGTTGQATGIYQSGGTTVNLFLNKVYDLESNGTSGLARGMYLAAGTANVINNLIGDIRTPNHSGTTGIQLAGIYINGGTAQNIYYNTVYVNGVSTGANFGSTAIYSSSTPALTLRNNIFVNTSVPNGSGITAAFRRSTATLTSYQAESNNNLFYAGTPGAANVIFSDGTSDYVTLGDYKAHVAPRDINSVTENPPFLSTSGTSVAFLHINATVATQVESGAVNIAGIDSDYDAEIRAGNPTYTGTGTFPDIGADEGNYIPTDLSAPAIVYTELTDACATGDRSFGATITDGTGIPLAGAFVPRVYFRKNSGSWFSQPGTFMSGTAENSDWNFMIPAATLGGLTVADTVSYFVIAQDVAPAENVGSNPSGGLVAADVNTVAVYPTTPNSYVILPSLSGTYNVGVGMAYTTITDAITAYNTSCVSGAVIFQLMDATYPGETFPIVINDNVSSSATNTLTIRPAAGVAPLITGNAAAIFRLNGADYVIIDGSNAPVTNSICPLVSSSRDLTISNTSTSTTSAVIWIQTTTDGDSSTNNIIRNLNIVGNGPTQTLAGIGSGSATISNSSLGGGNHNNKYENNSIASVQIGIYSAGSSIAVKNDGTIINQNVMTTGVPDNIGRYGILTRYENNITISGNSVGGVYYAGTGDVSAISVGIGFALLGSTVTTGHEVTNATVTYNRIDSFIANNAWSAAGIAVAGATSGTNTIANNMISRVLSRGTGGDFSAGIFISGVAGSVTNVYYNTVNLSGTLTGATYPSFALAISGADPTVNINNNIFVNTSSNGSAYSPYAIGFASSSYANITSNNNNLYTSGSAIGATGTLAGGGAQPTLADWQAATGEDAASVNILPSFASAGDMHLELVVANAPLNGAGTPLPISTDYDCETRAATPDIGADEFTIPSCSGAIAGTVSPATGTFCGSGTTTVTATGFSTTLGTEYQWLSSTDSIGWTPISGATVTTYIIDPAITDTTYFRFRVTCTFSGAADSATTTVIVNPLPVVSVSPDGGGYCSGTPGSVTMTASGAVTYTWSPGAGLSATTGATVTASPTATTAYSVTGTDAIGCEGTHVSTVTVTITPPPVTITPAADTICAGIGVPLVASSALPDTLYTESFNTGLGLWVIDNTGSTSAPALTQWTSRPNGYMLGAVTYHSPDATAFAMANSDAGGAGFITRTSMTSPTFSMDGYSSATLSFSHYYRYIASDVFARVEISTDGGGTWSTVHDYRADAVTVGSAASFGAAVLDLSAYAGSPSCQLRFNYGAGYGWYWSVDAITITGTGSYANITWSPSTGLYTDPGLDTAYTGGAATTVYASPAAATVTTYTATATNGTCSSTGTTTITVIPQPVAYNVTGGGALCAGDAGIAIGLSGSATGVDYQLYNGSTTVGIPVPGTGSVLDFGPQATAGTYTVLGTDAVNGCTTAMTDSAIIVVNPAPVTYTVTGGGAYCAGGTGLAIGLSGSDTGISYQLYNGSLTVGTPLAGTGAALDFGLHTAAGTYSVVATAVSTSCVTTMTGSAIIVVDPAPIVFTVTGGGAYCAGDTGVHVGLSGSQPGVDYQLYNGATPVGTSASGTGSAIDFGLLTAAGTYSVSAVNPTTTCTANMSGSAGITINPVPAAYTVTGDGAYCDGGAGVSIGLSGSATGVTYQLYLGATPIGSPISGTGGAISFGLQTLSGTYTVTGNGAGGCTALMSGSATITVNPLPTAYTMIGDGGYCAGDAGSSIGLTSSDAGITYQLYNGSSPVGAPLSGTGGTLDFGVHAATGSYSIVATNPVTGCAGPMSGTVVVVINSLPMTFAVTGGGSYCVGGSGVDIGLAGSEIGVNYLLYLGSVPTTSAVSGTGSAVSFGLQTSVGSYTVVGINATTGCAAGMSGSASITTIPGPAAYSISGGGAYCAGGPGVSIGLSGSDIGVSYQLFNGGSPVGSPIAGTGTSLNFGLQTAAGTYTVLATSSSTSCTTAMTGSTFVFINPSVPPSVSIVADADDTICIGTTVLFTAVPVNGGYSPTYQWSVNGVNTDTGVSFSYVPANGDVVKVVINSSPCAVPSTATSTMTMSVSSGVTPAVSITAAPGFTICAGSIITLTAAPVFGGSAPEYLWTRNGVHVATGPSYTFIPNNGDVVFTRMISSNPCRITDTATSSNVTITVVPLSVPVVTISALPGTTISAGQTATFTATVSGGGSAPTYLWSINGTFVPGATTAIFTTNMLSNGDVVIVWVTSSGLCGGITATAAVEMSVSGVGINSVVNSGIDLRLIPNPNKGIFTVKGDVGAGGNEEANLQVTDMLGQVIYEKTIRVTGGKVDENVSLDNSLANGMYLLQFMMGDKKAVFHFVVGQ